MISRRQLLAGTAGLPAAVIQQGPARMQAAGAPRAGDEAISVRDPRFGAVGDGRTDDRPAIQAALDIGGSVHIPAGTYLVSQHPTRPASLVVRRSGTQVIAAPDASVVLMGGAPGKRLVDIVASDATIRGGHWRGTWSMGRQNQNSIQDDRSRDQVLVNVSAGRGQSLRRITLEEAVFERAADTAVVFEIGEGGGLADIVVARCIFRENFSHLYFGNMTLAPGLERITVSDTEFDTTAAPAPGTTDGRLGGNAMTTHGPLKHLTVRNNRFRNSGRFALELWLDLPWWKAGHQSADVFVEDNDIGPCRYRAVTLMADRLTVQRNVIHSGDWVEFGGRDVSFVRNRIIGGGISTTTGYNEIVAQRQDRMILRILDNEFTDTPDQGENGAVLVDFGQDVAVQRNRIHYRYAVAGVKRACMRFTSCDTVAVADNTIVYEHPCDRPAALSFINIRRGRLTDNTFEFRGIPDGHLPAVVALSGLEDTVVTGNRTYASGRIRTASDFPLGPLAMTPELSQLRRRKAGDVLRAVAGPANDPPARAARDDVFLIGDAPRGAWAGHPLQFAEWDGASWRFTPVAGVLLHTPKEAPLNRAEHLPPADDGAGAYLAFAGGGLVRSVFSNNDFCCGGMIGARGDAARTGFVTRGDLVWHCVFADNVDAVLLRDPTLCLARIVEVPAAAVVPARTR